jgi:Cof subfamily protein (haloacid dehalogenase superfamily)
MIRLICTDIDGTLIGSSGDVAPAVWAAAERVRATGIRLAICSGRPSFGRTRAMAERLDRDGWHIFQNGASVVHFPSGETRSRPFTAAAVASLIARSRETGRVLELYTDSDYAVERDVERSRRHAKLLGIPFRLRDLLSLQGSIVRAQWLLAREEADAVMSEPHDGLAISLSLSPVMPDSAFANITPPGVDKGEALRKVAEVYGLSLDEVMMVGDSANDLAALQIAGVAVAMGNAEPEVREAAHHVVADVEHDGLVEAFDLAMRHS